jgi:hypothetical protein
MTKPRRIRRWITRFRSAVTGRYVTHDQADAAPSETVSERAKPHKRRDDDAGWQKPVVPPARHTRPQGPPRTPDGCTCGATQIGSRHHSTDCPAYRR